MPCVCYVGKNFSPAHLQVIDRANRIIDDYAEQGYDLTLRQVYYQFVSRGWIPNRDSEYKRLGSILNDARLAGLVDWEAITDRTRNLRKNSHWETPAEIIASAAYSFALDKWNSQGHRVEVWVEKDALVGVVGQVCDRLDVPYFSCRGYTSASEMWAASQRLLQHCYENQTPVILHLGDHDPSGIDMSRDIQDRLALFMEQDGYDPPRFERLALNRDQIDQYNPPPNPAKLTDSRCTGYIRLHGDESWELDALEPSVLADLIEDAVLGYRDEDAWGMAATEEAKHKTLLAKAAEDWQKIADSLAEVGQ